MRVRRNKIGRQFLNISGIKHIDSSMSNPWQGSISETTGSGVNLGSLTDDTIMGQTERVKLGGMIDTVTQCKQLEGAWGALCKAQSIRNKHWNTTSEGISTYVPEGRTRKVVNKVIMGVNTSK